jgi:hypothetical protein
VRWICETKKKNREVSTMTIAHHSLYERSLELAAGVPVSRAVYEAMSAEGTMNLAKLQALGKAYRQGWLANVLARITPLTTRETADYEHMAALFINTQAEAETLMAKLSGDLSRFAAMAGVVSQGNVIPMPMMSHVNMYQKIGAVVAEKFGMAVPAPFASATIDAQTQAAIPFVRAFVKERFAA